MEGGTTQYRGLLLKAQELPKDVAAVEPEKDVEEESAAKDDASAANEPFENNTWIFIFQNGGQTTTT